MGRMGKLIQDSFKCRGEGDSYTDSLARGRPVRTAERRSVLEGIQLSDGSGRKRYIRAKRRRAVVSGDRQRRNMAQSVQGSPDKR